MAKDYNTKDGRTFKRYDDKERFKKRAEMAKQGAKRINADGAVHELSDFERGVAMGRNKQAHESYMRYLYKHNRTKYDDLKAKDKERFEKNQEAYLKKKKKEQKAR